MIVPMTKVSLILLRSEKTAALKKLRRLGLVHIEITEGAGTEIETLRQQMQTLEGCINRLGKPEKGAPAKAMTPAEALAMAADVAAMDQAQQDCRSEQAALQAELARLRPGGEVDPAPWRAAPPTAWTWPSMRSRRRSTTGWTSASGPCGWSGPSPR